MQIELTFSKEFDALYESFAKTKEGLKQLKLEGIAPHQLDIGLASKKYFTERLADSTIDTNANSNEETSANNYQAEIAKAQMKLDGFFLIHKYATKRFGIERANELLTSLWKGELYFHDASGPGIQIPYCFAFSTKGIVNEGRPYGQLHSKAPKRADSFVAQVIEVCMDLSQEFAGAVAPSDFLIYYSYFSGKEFLSERQIENDMQKFIHVMNNKFRVSGQSPFSNVSIFDRRNLEVLCENIYFPDDTQPNLDEVMRVQKVFARFFAKGDPTSQLPYRFPVVTANIATDDNGKIIDEEFLDFISEVNIDKANFNIYVSEGSKIAMCCRFVNDFDRLNEAVEGGRVDSFGNGGTNIGSHRVVTINLPRMALEANKDIDVFYAILDKRLHDCEDLLMVHRLEILERRIENGFLKFFKPIGWFDLHMLFSTIGIIGTYEMANILGVSALSEEGLDFTDNVLTYIDNFARKATQETGWSFNTEQIPAESAAYKLAYKDKLVYPDSEFELYSNQFVPLIADVGIIDRIKMTGKAMKSLSGGGILHINIQDQMTSKDQMKLLIINSLKAGVNHLAVNYGFGKCSNGHVTICGNSSTCPLCGEPIVSHLTRVIGYFTEVENWGETRLRLDFPNRKFN